MLDLIIKNGECYINGALEKKDIGILKNKIVQIGDLKDKSKEIFYLNKPNEGLYIPERTWSYQVTKSQNSIYCVACSDYYDENDYIRNWNDFFNTNFDSL